MKTSFFVFVVLNELYSKCIFYNLLSNIRNIAGFVILWLVHAEYISNRTTLWLDPFLVFLFSPSRWDWIVDRSINFHSTADWWTTLWCRTHKMPCADFESKAIIECRDSAMIHYYPISIRSRLSIAIQTYNLRWPLFNGWVFDIVWIFHIYIWRQIWMHK